MSAIPPRSVPADLEPVVPCCRHCRRRAPVDTLVSGLANEINNPLGYITINLSYALEELREASAAGRPAPADVLASLEEARDGARRVASILRDLERSSGPGQGAAHGEMAKAAAPRRPGHVLVVTDQPLIGRSLRRMLTPHHQAEVAGSVPEALALLERAGGLFGVIVCDVAMPERTGIELHEALLGAHPDLAGRMVLLTGGAFAPRAPGLLSWFSGRRLEKPVDAVALRRVVADVLAKAA